VKQAFPKEHNHSPLGSTKFLIHGDHKYLPMEHNQFLGKHKNLSRKHIHLKKKHIHLHEEHKHFLEEHHHSLGEHMHLLGNTIISFMSTWEHVHLLKKDNNFCKV
jgi:hypothetical protein